MVFRINNFLKTFRVFEILLLFNMSCMLFALEGERVKDDIFVDKLTQMVRRRYYFIARLKKTMRILAKIKELTFQVSGLFKDEYEIERINALFSHPQIKESLFQVIRKKSIKPLFMVWDSFSSYHSIEDELLIIDFTKEIFIITRRAFLEEAKMRGYFNKNIVRLVPDLNAACLLLPEQLVDVIELMTNFLSERNTTVENSLNNLRSLVYVRNKDKGELEDIKSYISVQEVGMRYYYKKRLKEVLKLLKHLRQKNVNCFQNRKDNRIPVFDNRIVFHNKHVLETITKMQNSGKVDQLRILCKEIKQFKFISDDEFLKETLIALFIAQKNILINNAYKFDLPNKTIPLNEVLNLYQTVESLPIEEILNAIDLASTAINQTIDKKDSKLSTQWKEFFNKYWWIQPTIIGGSVMVKIIKHYHLLDNVSSYFVKA